MPQHPSIFSYINENGAIRVSGRKSPLYLGGIAFDENDITVMTTVVNEVCSEYAAWNTPEQREFIAWLVVRLSRNGIGDRTHLKSAVVQSLLPKSLLCS